MKYIKKFEFVRKKLKPHINDFVICDEKIISNEMQNFLKYNIGQLVDFNSSSSDKYYFSPIYKYIVKFENVPEKLKEYFTPDNLRGFNEQEIIYFSSNKEEVEIFLKTKNQK